MARKTKEPTHLDELWSDFMECARACKRPTVHNLHAMQGAFNVYQAEYLADLTGGPRTSDTVDTVQGYSVTPTKVNKAA